MTEHQKISDQKISEVIFIGLPGPSHHYSGLSPDNKASSFNRGSVSNPKQAALQALDLARLLRSLGVTCAFLPPQLRPHMPLLRQHFKGDDESVIRQAALHAQELLQKSHSAAAMWTANAATVTCRLDSDDHLLHITPANLFTNLHRRIEAEDTYAVLKAIFAAAPDCVVHPPLSAATGMRDEGAANHMRLAPRHGRSGFSVFVYGADGSQRDPASARQTLSASRALQAQHRIADGQVVFLRQNPDVIAQGVFHNDVIAVSNEHVLLAHRLAYDGGEADFRRIADGYLALTGQEPTCLTIADDALTVSEAVGCYFFNSQLVTKADGKMALIAPLETKLLYEARPLELMEAICDDDANPIDEVHTLDLRQSMRNGGGPACLRLRVPMNHMQLQAMAGTSRVLVDEPLLLDLERLIERYYPDSLSLADLGNIEIYRQSREVADALGELMRLPLLPPGLR